MLTLKKLVWCVVCTYKKRPIGHVTHLSSSNLYFNLLHIWMLCMEFVNNGPKVLNTTNVYFSLFCIIYWRKANPLIKTNFNPPFLFAKYGWNCTIGSKIKWNYKRFIQQKMKIFDILLRRYHRHLFINNKSISEICTF